MEDEDRAGPRARLQVAFASVVLALFAASYVWDMVSTAYTGPPPIMQAIMGAVSVWLFGAGAITGGRK